MRGERDRRERWPRRRRVGGERDRRERWLRRWRAGEQRDRREGWLRRWRVGEQRGQALVELVAGLPLALALAAVLLQLLASGYAAVLAGSAAEAGALALAGGGDARAAAERALPDWSRRRAAVDVGDDAVRVRLRPPSLIRALAERLEVSATAAVELDEP